MHSKLIHYLDALSQYLIIIGLPLALIFFLPVTENYYDTNKWLLLMIIALLTVLLWLAKTLLSGKIKLHFSLPALVFGGLTLTALLSLIIASLNKVEAALTPLGITTFGALFLIFLLAGNLTAAAKTKLKWSFLAMGLVAGLIAIYQYFSLTKTLLPNVSFLANPLWTPVGASLPLIALLLLTLPLFFSSRLTLITLISLIPLSALALTTIQLFPRLTTGLLPFWAGWAITLETLKNPLTAVFGVGAENFVSAFTRSRPVSLNLTPIWNLIFTTNVNFPLHQLVTSGILGLIASFGLIISLVPKKINGLGISLVLAILALILIPPTLPLLIAVAILLLLKDDAKSFSFPTTYHLLSTTLALILALLIGLSGYFLARAYAAELTFYKSLLSFQANDGTTTYNLQAAAIKFNPKVSRFHLAASQTDLALAETLLTNSASDSALATSLIEQSINEAKLALSLNPQNAVYWRVLGDTYQKIMPLVKGADDWSLAAYQKAISLDPTNPSLRLSLGNLYFSGRKLDEALNSYFTSVTLKKDYPNAYYNLATVFQEKKDYLNAALSLRHTLNYMSTGDPDYPRVNRELEFIKGKLSQKDLDLLEGKSSSPLLLPSITPISNW